YTGSVGRYFGSWWSMGRVYVSPAPGENDVTAEAALRRYYQDGDNWVGGRLSFGTTPREDAAEEEVSPVEAVRARFEGSRALSKATGITFGLGLEREDPSPAAARSRVELTIGLRRDF
ncbi:MAG TPA: YaiO family outer membrane beta-barrel protein, partial [Longimicrobium sp.]|nr:YaiO family outer membrane beta-barrel protein [Longimicrobium sp.]